MLYVDSILKNYDIPNVPPNLALRAEKEKIEIKKLYDELLRKDPDAAGFIEPHHQQRIIRALEVIEAIGKPFSIQRRSREPRYDITVIGLFPAVEELQRNIEKRCREMLTQGLIEETKVLRAQYGSDLPLLKTMNYTEAGAVIDGRMSQEEALAAMIRSNMRYARRQMSWWRGRKMGLATATSSRT